MEQIYIYDPIVLRKCQKLEYRLNTLYILFFGDTNLSPENEWFKAQNL